MKKVYINRRIVDGPWGGGAHFIRAIKTMCKDHGWVNVESLNCMPDVVLMIHPNAEDGYPGVDELIRYKQLYGCKLIHRVNETSTNKQMVHIDPWFKEISKYTDATVFVSNWMKQYFTIERKWYCDDIDVILNGVDRNIFFEKRSEASDSIRIVSHHWSKNHKKGADVYEFLDKFVSNNDGYSFEYIGRHDCKFKNTTIVDPIAGMELSNALRENDVYISGSVADPGPNHIIEAISCGLPTYAKSDGGGAREFVGEDHVYNSFEELEALLLSKKFERNNVTFTDWDECVAKFCAMFDRLTNA